MSYTAKLVVGGQYFFKGYRFERGVEVPVTQDEAEYLKTAVDHRLIEQGDGFQRISVPVFEITEVVPTLQEKVLEEVKDVPDTLKPKK